MSKFLPGNKMGGRTAGSRNRLSKAFIDALAKDFEEHGEATIRVLRCESPGEYARLCASLVPRDLNLELTDRRTELAEWLTWMQSPEIMGAMLRKPADAPPAPELPALPPRKERPPLPKIQPFDASEHAQREAERLKLVEKK